MYRHLLAPSFSLPPNLSALTVITVSWLRCRKYPRWPALFLSGRLLDDGTRLLLRGEGALIHLDLRFTTLLANPFPIIVLSTPSTMQVTQLRKETRYEVNSVLVILMTNERTQIRDPLEKWLSLCHTPTSVQFVADRVSIEITPEN